MGGNFGTMQSLKVLKAFIDAANRKLAGSDVMKATGLKSGTAYAILLRLEAHGMVSSEWEQLPPEELGRPRRRYYSLTAGGRARAHQLLADAVQEFSTLVPAWRPS